MIAEHKFVFFIFCSFCELKLADFLFVSTAVEHWVYESLELDNKLGEKIMNFSGRLGNYLTLFQSKPVILFHTAKTFVNFVERPDI